MTIWTRHFCSFVGFLGQLPLLKFSNNKVIKLQARAREENLVYLNDLQLSGMFWKADSDGKGLERKGSFQCGLEQEAKKTGQGERSRRKKVVGQWD